MRYPDLLLHSVAFAALVAAMIPLHARIGESKSTLESRLLAAGALAYKAPAILEERRKGMPYENLLPYLGDSYELEIYHKSADGDRPKRSLFDPRRMNPGWDLHVVYYKGISAVEVYVRNINITEQERNLLVTLQGRGQRWKIKAQQAAPESGEADPGVRPRDATAFGYEMVSADESVRATELSGRSLLFVDAAFDARLEMAREDNRDQDAPVSIRGF